MEVKWTKLGTKYKIVSHSAVVNPVKPLIQQEGQMEENDLDTENEENRPQTVKIDEQQKEKASLVSKYTVPILVTGGVVILGIVTYFVFKKKKIN